MNLRKLAAALTLVVSAAAFANDFGVQLVVDVPLEAVATFPANPLGYDLVSLNAFYESGAYGLRVDVLSGNEASVGVYYRAFVLALNAAEAGAPAYGAEATVGVYGGYNWRSGGWFFRVRGKYLLYGSH